MKTLLTTEELAERWGISTVTINRWRTKRHGPPYLKLDKSVRYRLEDIIKYEENNLVTPGGSNVRARSTKRENKRIQRSAKGSSNVTAKSKRQR